MADRKELRIAIFQYDLPLQSYSRDLAVKLGEMGAKVEFFGFRLGDRNFVSRDAWSRTGIVFHDFGNSERAGDVSNTPLARISEKLRWRWSRREAAKIFGTNLHFLDRSVLLGSKKILGNNRFDLFIGIEQHGLIWAGMMSAVFGTPFFYYNLELYVEDNKMMMHLGHLRKSEIFFHRQAAATIVQDRYRAEALRNANDVATPAILLPVSVKGPVNRVKTHFLMDRLDLRGDPVLLLFFGGIAESRLCHIIVEANDYLPNNFFIVFHGYAVEEDYYIRLKEMAKGRRVLFSDADLEESKIDVLLASADIGFALYLNDNVNDRLSAFAAQKVALFCRNGVPFISNRNESYEDLFQQFGCGEMAATPRDIANAAVKIHRAHNEYREQCFQAFSAIYDLDRQFQALQQFVEAGEWKASS